MLVGYALLNSGRMEAGVWFRNFLNDELLPDKLFLTTEGKKL